MTDSPTGALSEREAFHKADLRDEFGEVPTYRERELMFTAWQARAALASRSTEPGGEDAAVLLALRGMQRFWGKYPEFVCAPEFREQSYAAVEAMNAALASFGPHRKCDRVWQLMMLSAAAKSGDEGVIKLAAKLCDALPCEGCGYIHTHCRCALASTPPPISASKEAAHRHGMLSDGVWHCFDCDTVAEECTNPPRLASKEAAPAGDWQTIETANKYGEPVWLFDPALIEADFNPTGTVDGHWQDDEGWMGAVWDGYRDEWSTKVINPTHWMARTSPAPAQAPRSEPRAPVRGLAKFNRYCRAQMCLESDKEHEPECPRAASTTQPPATTQPKETK